jgi:hypothetical protein
LSFLTEKTRAPGNFFATRFERRLIVEPVLDLKQAEWRQHGMVQRHDRPDSGVISFRTEGRKDHEEVVIFANFCFKS